MSTINTSSIDPDLLDGSQQGGNLSSDDLHDNVEEIKTQLGNAKTDIESLEAGSDIGDLNDVSITSPGDDEVIAYDNTSGEWINQTAAEAGLAGASHTHTLADVTDSGTAAPLDVPATGDAATTEVVKGDDTRLSDARTPTAHTHTEADITDLGNYAVVGHSHTLSDITDSGAAAAKGVTGLDANAVTGTAGTSGNLSEWNADGDLVDSGVASSSLADLTANETVTGSWTFNDHVTLDDNIDLQFYSNATGGVIGRVGGGASERKVNAYADRGWEFTAGTGGFGVLQLRDSGNSNIPILARSTANVTYSSIETILDNTGSGTEEGHIRIRAIIGGTLTEILNLYGDGVVVGSPTGGAQGAGTINAEGVYDDGSLLTDYVFDAEIDGSVDTVKWDDAVPNRERVIEKADPEKGKPERTEIEERVHEPAREFDLTENDPSAFAVKWKTDRKLPAMKRLSDRVTARGGNKPGLGESIQALMETCEAQAVHIEKLRQEIEDLKSRGA